MSEFSLQQLESIAAEFGLTLLGVLPVDKAKRELSNDIVNLKRWQQQGHAGEMDYMERDASLFADFEHFLPGIKSIACFAVSYYWRDELADAAQKPLPEGYGRVARYAWGRDYHRVLKKRLVALVKHVSSMQTARELKSRVFTDAVPLLERALARSANLGFIGKNTLLIRPGLGSFTLLGEILWDLEIAPPADTVAGSQPSGSCSSCTRCITKCPTDAILEGKQIDARKCISYLTIEKKGEFDEWQRHAVGEWVFGCDICQEVCPFNHKSVAAPLFEEFSAAAGAGPVLNLSEVILIREDQEYSARFQGTPLMRAGRQGLLRNALAVIGNTNALKCINPLLVMEEQEESIVLKRTALITLEKLLLVSSGIERRTIESRLSARSKEQIPL